MNELRTAIDYIVNESGHVLGKRVIENLMDLAKYKYNKMLSKSLHLLVLKYDAKLLVINRGKSTQVSSNKKSEYMIL